MKLLVYAWYMLRSIVLRGPWNAVQLALMENRRERELGICTTGIQLSGEQGQHHYQGATYFSLEKVLKNCPYRQLPFIDIGSGMGRAAFEAEKQGFNDITGIEIRQELVDQSLRNITTYKNKRPGSNIRFVCANALSFDYPNRPSFYFLFNPFDDSVLIPLLKRIRQQNAHESYFLYLNPKFAKSMEDSGLKRVKNYRSFLYTEAILYRMDALKYIFPGLLFT